MKIIFAIISVIFFKYAVMAETLTETLGAQSNPTFDLSGSFQKGVEAGKRFRTAPLEVEQQRLQNEILKVDLEQKKFDAYVARLNFCASQCERMFKSKKLKKGVTVEACIETTCN